MAVKLTRRDFLTLATGATALGLAGCGDASDSCPDGTGACALPEPSQAPFDTVVVLMMENRSFDHLLGWLPGADGRQQGLEYADIRGVMHATRPLAPDFQGCAWDDPDHTWPGIATQYAGGRCDGFLKTTRDQRPLSASPDEDAYSAYTNGGSFLSSSFVAPGSRNRSFSCFS